MNVWQDSTGGNGNSTKQMIQFFVILDGQGDVMRDDTRLLLSHAALQHINLYDFRLSCFEVIFRFIS